MGDIMITTSSVKVTEQHIEELYKQVKIELEVSSKKTNYMTNIKDSSTNNSNAR